MVTGVYPGRENWSLDKVLCAWAGELVKRATSYWDSKRQEWPSRGQIPYVQHKGEVMHPVRTHTQHHLPPRDITGITFFDVVLFIGPVVNGV